MLTRSKVRGPVRDMVQNRIRESIELKHNLLADTAFQDSLALAASQILKSLRAGGKIFFFGNGGSAADAQHLAAEFAGRYLKERRALPAMALTVNSSALTAIGNDYGFDFVFARQLEAVGKKGDVALGISTSGNSTNVLRALKTAKSISMFTVALTGWFGGRLQKVADCAIRIPSRETPRIQEAHILVGHILCEVVEQALFPNSGD